jgi:hypothetical protein
VRIIERKSFQQVDEATRHKAADKLKILGRQD